MNYKRLTLLFISGLILGIIFPVIFVALDLDQFNLEYNSENAIEVINSQKIYFFSFITFPIVFGIIAVLLQFIRSRGKEKEDLGKILEDSVNEIYIYDVETLKYLYLNESARKNLKIEVKDIKNTSVLDVEVGLTIDIHKKRQSCAEKAEGGVLVFETLYERKDQSTYPVECHFQKGRYQNQECYVDVVLDTSEREKLQNEIFQNMKLSSIGEMAAGVGHEINNPLAISVGNLRLLRLHLDKSNLLNDKIDKFLEKIQIANERIRRIVDGLRTYARSDSEQVEVISLNQAINQTLNLVSEIYEKEGVIIRNISSLDEILCVKGSLGKLQQVIMNLMSNAKDATEGQKERTIILNTRKDNKGRVEISIKDNGPGINEELKSKIFDPFFTTKVVGKGTGMGLGLVLELLKSMEGELKFETELGKGTEFIVTFKECGEDGYAELDKKQKEANQDVLSMTAPTFSARALVVDDEEDIREIIQHILEGLGLSVMIAASGKDALEILESNSFDYIFTDMKMPHMRGDKFIEEAKKITSEKTKYIVVTGGVSTNYSSPNDVSFVEIADYHILKPFSEDDFVQVLSDLRDIN